MYSVSVSPCSMRAQIPWKYRTTLLGRSSFTPAGWPTTFSNATAVARATFTATLNRYGFDRCSAPWNPTASITSLPKGVVTARGRAVWVVLAVAVAMGSTRWRGERRVRPSIPTRPAVASIRRGRPFAKPTVPRGRRPGRVIR